MQPNTRNQKTPSHQGSSPVGVQVAVAVLALLSALAVPHLERMQDSPEQAKSRHDAQSIMAAANEASAAGVVFPNLEAAIKAMTSEQGVSPAKGPFTNQNYRGPQLSADEIKLAASHLDFVEGTLIYKNL